MGRKNQKWNIGDIFTVQLNDGTFVVGQVIGREAKVLNSVTVAFYDLRFDSEEEVLNLESLASEDIFSTVFATRESLDSGTWHIVGQCPVVVPENMMPYEDLRSAGFVGAIVRGSGILDEFLNAYYALMPWDDWKDPDYLDQLLISKDKKPQNLVYKNN
ncbi:MAG: Imm26 family immunity protein [Pseudomonadota bacterium]|nr:Imm26 family immunity protein [Pseudomonadota bacterium]